MLSSALVDMLPVGVLVLNRQAKILFANAFATEVLLAGADLNAVDGLLHLRSVPHSRALSEALHRLACSETPEPVGCNIARTNRRPLSIVLAKLPRRGKAFATPEKCRIALFFSDPECYHRPSASLVRDLFQFTPLESSIAILMMESLDTAAIAHELAIARNTLRDHLKSMFSKTHTRNQGELLHILLRCPVGLTSPLPVENARFPRKSSLASLSFQGDLSYTPAYPPHAGGILRMGLSLHTTVYNRSSAIPLLSSPRDL